MLVSQRNRARGDRPIGTRLGTLTGRGGAARVAAARGAPAIDAGFAFALAAAALAFALALLAPMFLNLFWQIPDGIAIAHGHFPQRVDGAIESGPLIAQEWLFEFAAGWLVVHELYPVLVIGCALAAAATPLLVYRLACTARCGTLAAGVVAMLCAAAGLAASPLRPETFAVDLFALVLIVLVGRAPVLLLAPIVALWANLHASMPLALVACTAYAVGTGLRRRAGAALGIACAASLATPFGLRLWTYAWSLAIVPNPVRTHLQAWRALSFDVPGTLAVVLPGLLLFMLLGAVVRRRTAPELLVAAVVFFATLAHQRTGVFLAVAWAVPLARTLDERTPLGIAARRRPHAPLLALLPFALYALVLLPGAVQARPDRAGPWQAAAAIAQRHHLHGNLYTDYAWASYLRYRGLPFRVLIDAHADPYPARVWDDVTALEQLRPGWDAVLRRRAIETVIVPADAPLAQALALRPDWAAVELRDGVAAYALRR